MLRVCFDWSSVGLITPSESASSFLIGRSGSDAWFRLAPPSPGDVIVRGVCGLLLRVDSKLPLKKSSSVTLSPLSLSLSAPAPAISTISHFAASLFSLHTHTQTNEEDARDALCITDSTSRNISATTKPILERRKE